VVIPRSGSLLSTGGAEPSTYEHVVESPDDLPSPVAGVRTLLDGVTRIVGTVTLPAGESVEIPDAGVLFGRSSSIDTLAGDVDGPLINCPFGAVIAELKTCNVNTGSSAEDIRLSSVGRTSRIEHCSFQGHRVGTAINHIGLVSIFNSIATGPTPGSGPVDGLKLKGTIAGVQFVGLSSGNVPAGYVGVELDAGATILLAVLVRDCNFVHLSPTDVAIKLSDSATLPGDASVAVLDCAHVGGGSLFDESAGHLTPSSLEVIARGNATARDSKASAAFGFSETGGAVTTINTVDVWENIETGVGVTLLTHATERFEVVDSDPTDGTFAKYLGPLDNQPTGVLLHVSVERFGGSGNNKYEVKAEKYDDLLAAWADIAGSHFLVESSGAADPIPLTCQTLMSKNDKIRFRIRNRTDADDVRVLAYQASIAWG